MNTNFRWIICDFTFNIWLCELIAVHAFNKNGKNKNLLLEKNWNQKPVLKTSGNPFL